MLVRVEYMTMCRYNDNEEVLLMLDELLDKNNMSAYTLSKKTGIPYSTISDIRNHKTDIKNVSAQSLYLLSKSLGVSMEQLYLSGEETNTIYLYNEGRNVYVVLNSNKFMYLGPKNLIGFFQINGIHANTIYVDTFFIDNESKIYIEEDYIDLADVLGEKMELLDKPYKVLLGNPHMSKARHLIENSLMISDNMAINKSDLESDTVVVEVINLKRNREKCLIRLIDYMVLYTNMSERMKNRAIASVKRNQEQLIEEIQERENAKIYK